MPVPTLHAHTHTNTCLQEEYVKNYGELLRHHGEAPVACKRVDSIEDVLKEADVSVRLSVKQTKVCRHEYRGCRGADVRFEVAPCPCIHLFLGLAKCDEAPAISELQVRSIRSTLPVMSARLIDYLFSS
eukprot:1160220-Pelagomonas_calceolata.AAC.4